MFEYFYGIEDEFYVDVGAFHPIDRSNTRFLKSMGWRGINVDANYVNVNRFFVMNADDFNLNYAIG